MGDRTTPGFVLARVVDTEDPEARHRVKLQRLDRADGVETDWFPVVSAMAHDAAGFVTQPEVDDLAVVGFTGDQGLVFGYLYSGDDAVPAEAVTQRIWQSVNGHKVVLDDGDADGVTVSDAHGNTVVMSGDGIALESASDVKVKASGNIEIEASGTVTIKGQMVELNP